LIIADFWAGIVAKTMPTGTITPNIGAPHGICGFVDIPQS
jgi:hypothetical protein